MKTRNPYSDLAPQAFWKTGVAECKPSALQELYQKKFSLQPGDTIAAAGSCFAQRISQHLKLHGYQVADYEPRPSHIAADNALEYGYDMYSARYGNIYTVQQLLQLAQEAAGLVKPEHAIWERDGKFFDAMRPNIQPGGFASAQAVIDARDQHIRALGKMFCKMDVFIFTLGLTEAWRHRQSGTVYPISPGVIAGEFDPQQYEFVNYSLAQNKAAFEEFLAVVCGMRKLDEPDFKMILTVSPVPLTATASGQHVLQATTYSKSVLRVLADELWQKHDFIDYFPSFEIITNQMAGGSYYQRNGRSIQDSGVAAVMTVFFNQHACHAADSAGVSKQEVGGDHCDEVLLDAFTPGAADAAAKAGGQGATDTQSRNQALLFFGNSHLAAVKKAITQGHATIPKQTQSWFLASNWLQLPWERLEAHHYLLAPQLKPESAQLCSLPSANECQGDITLVLVGQGVLGDGIIRAFGELRAGNDQVRDGSDISPTLPLLNSVNAGHVRKRYEKHFHSFFQTLESLCQQRVYRDIYIIESPNMTERCARFRLGEEFVQSGSYAHYESIARSVVEEYASRLNIKLIPHPRSYLAASGFSLDRYASTDKPYDIHVNADYYLPALAILRDCLDVGHESGRAVELKARADARTGKGLSRLGELASILGFRRRGQG